MERIKVIVEGRVQGVGYRYFVKRQADTHQVKGHVKNLSGGAVEIDAEGETFLLEAF